MEDGGHGLAVGVCASGVSAMTEEDTAEAFELHDPLAEDLSRLMDTWGLATLIHGVKCMAIRELEGSHDEDERKRLELIAMQLDGAWCDAEGAER